MNLLLYLQNIIIIMVIFLNPKNIFLVLFNKINLKFSTNIKKNSNESLEIIFVLPTYIYNNWIPFNFTILVTR